jgi:transposase
MTKKVPISTALSAVHNITRRAPPAEFANWNSIWKRFWRLSEAGVFEALASMSDTAHLVQVFDSTVVRAHVSAADAKGGRTAKHSIAHAVDFRARFI